MDSLTEEQARIKLQRILDWHYSHHPDYSESNLHGNGGDGYVEHYITKMYGEFGGKWDEAKAREFINSLAAEQGLRNV